MKLKLSIIFFLILFIFINPVFAKNQQDEENNIYFNKAEDLYLLAKIIHAEARGEPFIGKVAVGAVIINRVNSNKFPNEILEVIQEPLAFTAVNDGQFNLEPDHQSYQAAILALQGNDPTNDALFYYNPIKTTSNWIYNRPVVAQIGKHIFAK
ncbi:cell wall hydrolase [Orenia marismortui]|uniref:cell wall hydrolase n=1 Tax=Orenia marismortui TaxID=46469 RepID=UPI000366D621|nr:cell wall hydrolase [Orenia marismortui]